MLRLLGGLVAASIALGSFASGQTLEMLTPREILELEGGLDVVLQGDGFYDETPDILVFADGIDVTSQVTITLEEETRLDQDDNGILEDYYAEFSLDFGTFAPSAGDLLVVEARATAPGGDVIEQASTAVRSHVYVNVDDAIVSGTSDVAVFVEIQRMTVQAQTLRVHLDGVEVTSQVTITGPNTSYEVVESGSPPFVRYRIQDYEVDIGNLGNIEGARVRFTVSATAAGGGASASAGSATSAGTASHAALTNCQKEALEAFVSTEGIGATKDAETGAVSVAADAAGIKDAADDLQAALAACGDSIPTSPVSYTTGNGIKMKIDLSGSDAKASGTEGQKKDLVVAIGSDGSGNGDGGSAEASNSYPGGVAIAVGGDGGSDATSAGEGGSAKATATPPGGLAAAVGGNGGSPSDPKDAGGTGGAASGQCGSTGTQPGGTGSPGDPQGKFGGGGWVTSTPEGTSTGELGPYLNPL